MWIYGTSLAAHLHMNVELVAVEVNHSVLFSIVELLMSLSARFCVVSLRQKTANHFSLSHVWAG